MRRVPACILLLTSVAGCGGDPYKIVPVSGQVTLNGKPLANASITFAPIAPKGSEEAGPSSAAKTDAQGRYTLQLVGKPTMGAMVGKHKVMIALSESTDASDDRPSPVKQLPLKYNGQTTLEFDVPVGGSETADFKLTVP